jgi:uncharacterized protein YutE (UPF0331/DUF86 family)
LVDEVIKGEQITENEFQLIQVKRINYTAALKKALIDGEREISLQIHFNFSEFEPDFRNVPSATHLLQTSIEALADISRYVIRSLSLPPAEECWQIPMILSDAGYIAKEDAEIYVKMVWFRNLVVHHYYRANPEGIYRILTENLT